LKGLLQRDPSKRLGSEKGDAEEIKRHLFFKGVDWDLVYKKKVEMPKPTLQNLGELTAIDGRSVYQNNNS